MCTHQRKIKNRYTGREMYVKCGHCPSCLQEKAAYRVSRIKAQYSDDLTCFMVGLTYRRHDLPYVKRDEAYQFSRGRLLSLPVYRDTRYRKVRQNASYDVDYRKYVGTHVLDLVDFKKQVSFHGLKDARHKPGCIGVAYYPDVQDFLERLRINLKRNYHYEKSFKAFCCSEYGIGTEPGHGTLRPHFHILLWIPKGSEGVFRSAIIASWPYGDLSRFPRAIEEARDASSYVASYVNSGVNFPPFLQLYFKAKHSYSKDFGCNYEWFVLPKVLELYRRGHLSLRVQKTVGNVTRSVECPLPKYVIHRYFPKFKGYGGLSPSAALSYMQRVRNAFRVYSDDEWRLNNPFLYEYDDVGYKKDGCEVLKVNGVNLFYAPSPVTDLRYLDKITGTIVPYQEFTYDDYYKTAVRLDNAYYRFLEMQDELISFKDYCKLHLKVWSLYSSDVLRLHLQNEEIPLNEKYDNLDAVLAAVDVGKSSIPLGFTREMMMVSCPNDFKSVKRNTARFEKSYYEHMKHHCVNFAVLSSQFEEF